MKFQKGDLIKSINTTIGSPIWIKPFIPGPIGPRASPPKCIGYLDHHQIGLIIDSNSKINFYRIISKNCIGWINESTIIKINDS